MFTLYSGSQCDCNFKCLANQGIEFEQTMIYAIQKAYYLKAQNPSYLTTLSSLAADIGLNKAQFEKDIASTGLEHQLQQQLQQARQLSNQGFPSLVLEHEGKLHPIPLDYNKSDTMHQAIMALIS